MADNNSGVGAIWFVAGAAVGATLALLFAPESGEKTRRRLAKHAQRGSQALSNGGRDLYDRGRDVYDRGRRSRKKRPSCLSAAVKWPRRKSTKSFSKSAKPSQSKACATYIDESAAIRGTAFRL